MSQTATAERTTTENIQPPPAANVPAKTAAPLIAGGKLGAIIPQDMEQAYRLAQWIAVAGWAPKGYLIDPKNANAGFSVEKIVIGILHGMEVGFTPMASLQSIAVINGTPTIWGDGALALVLSSGICESHVERPIMNDKGECVGYTCTMKRKGRADPIEQRFDEAEAKAAQLFGKSGPWQQYRRRMYQMRARAWCIRDGFSDVMRGLAIREEVEDMIEINPQPTPPGGARPRTAGAALDAFAGQTTKGSADPAMPSAVKHVYDAETGEVIDNGPAEKTATPAPDPAASAPAQAETGKPPIPPETPPASGQAGLPLAPPAAGDSAAQTVDADGLPDMPAAAKEAFDKGQWMAAWRWLSMQIEAAHPEQAQQIADKHAAVLVKVAAHNTSYGRNVRALLERHNLEVNLNGNGT